MIDRRRKPINPSRLDPFNMKHASNSLTVSK